MDTITHTLFGLTTYGAINKNEMNEKTKRALLFSSLVGSQIPDIDVIANVTETGRIMEQMWHRGLTHSFFLVPMWALIIYAIAFLIWKRKDKLIFFIACLNVFIHNASDALNAWGTGVFEPFSQVRVTFGVIPIVDFVIWVAILLGFLIIRVKKEILRHKIWRIVWCFILIYVAVQSIQGYIILNEANEGYEQVALSASFVPSQFTVIGKKEQTINLYSANIWSKNRLLETVISSEEASLEPLFEKNPKAVVLMEWAPFVVVVETDERLGVYDPRFLRNGESFLFEYITLTE
ncbi:metal-dependent hydrolase [Halalkalibacter kiskunsagensis]|uniref:Metal-dependent hydrolase n=1 Tax=Halalkalibacter kiskunsagensis TaxID=1548599 RepID=A0ABV6K9V7_9BACI